MTELTGIRDAARQLGLAHTTIGRYVRAHPEVNRGSKDQPKVNVDALRRHRAENTNPVPRGRKATKAVAQAPKPPDDTPVVGPNYLIAKAVRETVLAQRARVDLDEKRGLLVPRQEFENSAYDAGTVLQRDLLELGAQLAERLAAMTDTRAIAALMETEHRRVLATLAASLRAKAESEHAEERARGAAQV